MSNWNIEYWINESEIKKIEYSDYWDNEDNEKGKEWNILDGDFSKMESYLQKSGLLYDLKICVECLKNDFKIELCGVGIDLAAGNLWAASYLFNMGKIEKLYCLEYSRHRLLKIGKEVLEHYNVPQDKISLVLGSFYDLHVSDNSLDFVFLSQAFHHADSPDKLLSEIHRVLKPNGVVIIIGEHIIYYENILVKHAIKYIISILIPKKVQHILFGKTYHVKTLIPTIGESISSDPILGDHCYTDKEYRLLFSKYGFKIKQNKNHKTRFQSFVLVNNA